MTDETRLSSPATSTRSQTADWLAQCYHVHSVLHLNTQVLTVSLSHFRSRPHQLTVLPFPFPPDCSVLASNRDEFLARPTTRASFHDWSPSLSSHTRFPTPTNLVLSGQDLEAGGTWLGISFPPSDYTKPEKGDRVIRFATLTNFTETILPTNPPRPSRGKLVRDFLDYKGELSVEGYLEGLEKEKSDYAGFNLLVAELRLPSTSSASSASTSGSQKDPITIGYCSNRETSKKKARVLPSFDQASQVRGLSNATLEAEPGEDVWPKVKSGCLSVEEAVRATEEKGEEELVEKLWETLR